MISRRGSTQELHIVFSLFQSMYTKTTERKMKYPAKVVLELTCHQNVYINYVPIDSIEIVKSALQRWINDVLDVDLLSVLFTALTQ